MTQTARDWLASFAAEVEIAPLTAQEVDLLLELAGTAAHASERQAAPLTCWLAARAGVDPRQALDVAKGLAAKLAPGQP